MSAALPEFDVPPYRLSGVVIAALLNDPALLAALGDAVDQAPYKGAPRAPVLAIKPRNTFAGDGDAVVVPAGVAALDIGATLGIVIGRSACRVACAQALGHVAGYTIANDLSVPVTSHYRPNLRLRARDGFCPIGPRVLPAAEVPDPDALDLEIMIDGQPVQRGSTAGRSRGVAQLIADVSEFMTLQPGDLLLLGAAAPQPQARAGQRVAIAIAGLGCLSNRLVAEMA